MDAALQSILLRDNPWLSSPDALPSWLDSHIPSPLVPRSVVRENATVWNRENRAHLVIGPRQAGKSTAIWCHLASSARPVLFIDCEQPLVQQWCTSAPLFLADIEDQLGRPEVLFFEEAQHLENAGLFLKGIVDRKPGTTLLVTGSSSFHLGARVRESLAGRASRTRLLPFSLAELLSELETSVPAAREHEESRLWRRHVVVGGYPEVWLSEDPTAILIELIEAVVLRDASDLYRVARPDAFRRLLHLAAGQVGQLVNLAEWASILGISRDTVGAYLEMLEAEHLLVQLRPYAGGKRSELTRAPKLFFVDNGIRHQLINDLRPLPERVDIGPALENWVFSELWKLLPRQSTLHYWRSTSKAEVDFVLATPDKLLGIEVKASRSNRNTLTRSSRSFIEAYQPSTFFIVHQGTPATETLGRTELKWIHPITLAREITTTLESPLPSIPNS